MTFKSLATTAAASVMGLSSFAFAKTIELRDEAADRFIERHFPDADIPGPVDGVFKYINRKGELKQGYADCDVPAMGERSDGAVSVCTIEY